ncbi:E3 ubiquitin-protein like [Abeliophyllum distichum]|uniref:E3 ubiquitin-protein like n=1 Tax=Abeliophyllum distichum TaxID=126358 RepID=A0ABD1Q5K4_9LAMI
MVSRNEVERSSRCGSEITRVDLECGRQSFAGIRTDTDEESLCFFDTKDGSCYSQFYATTDGDASYDDYNFACGSRRGEILVAFGKSSSDCSLVHLETGKNKMHFGKVERDCRICHLSLVSSSPETGVAVEFGCSCKDDLAVAHKHCAETWFKIKGNK